MDQDWKLTTWAKGKLFFSHKSPLEYFDNNCGREKFVPRKKGGGHFNGKTMQSCDHFAIQIILNCSKYPIFGWGEMRSRKFP